ncbi:hypothetical protein IA69_00215 [Massilia sp. JS1662]|nr:DUF2946 family protein [Massilia sp. JS1662]KGF83282.1 hypothetical protein IA69_00215 [Massilia sp. JS1662]
MHSHRPYRAWIVRIVCCTLLLGLFAPALRHAGAGAAAFTEICSTTGVRLVRLDDAPDAPKKTTGQHCLACCVQPAAMPGPAVASSATAVRVAFATRPTAAVAAIATAPGAAWPRAPPYGS